MNKQIIVLITAFSLLAFASNHCLSFGRQRVAQKTPIGPKPSSIETIEFGAMAIAGSGCPEETFSYDLSGSSLLLKVKFDAFQVALSEFEKNLERKHCGIAIPIQKIPARKKLNILQVLLRGHQALTAPLTGRVSLDAFFAGHSGTKMEREFSNHPNTESGPFEIRQTEITAIECDTHTGIFRLNTALLAQRNERTEKNETLGNEKVSQLKIQELEVIFSLQPCTEVGR